jgi:3-ketosteroid 9alpha-monooxygenase subunit A
VSLVQSEDEVRVIDSGAAPVRFARGWHCLGPADEFTDGKPHSVQAFGEKLVVFATSGGSVKVLDAYCRHMGGDLSQGTIKGDEVACPFHDWRWGGDGRCKKIPYARRVPPRARTRAWNTLVQDRLLFLWNDPEGNPPPDEVTIPRIEGAESPEWTDWIWKKFVVEGSNCREIVDNVVDMAHFFYVHYSFPTFFKNVFENHVATQYQRGSGREDVRPPAKPGEPTLSDNESTASYYGPSFMIDELLYNYDDGSSVENVLINCHYPISPTSFVLQYGIIVKKATHLAGDAAERLAAASAEHIGRGFEQDIAIWRNKTRIDNPLLCEEDGPVYQLRRWYEQFYVDAADVTPDMTNRFEFELDTTRPVEAWKQEVAEIMASRSPADASVS